jgi:hypothetical protein
LDIITKTALIQTIRDLTEDSVITGEQASVLVKRLRTLRTGTIEDLVNAVEEALAEPSEDSHDSGIGDSARSETSTRLNDSSDDGTESICGSDCSCNSDRKRKNKGSWRKLSRKKKGTRRFAKRKGAATGGWEDCSDSEELWTWFSESVSMSP